MYILHSIVAATVKPWKKKIKFGREKWVENLEPESSPFLEHQIPGKMNQNKAESIYSEFEKFQMNDDHHSLL